MADLTVITKQVIDLLGANSYSAGVKVYSATSGDTDFLDGAISRAIEEAKVIAAEAVCEAALPTRRAFVQADQAITHGALLPVHYGEIFDVKIVPYSGANAMEGKRTDSKLIAAYRNNFGALYGAFAHNAQDTVNNAPSQLAGFYATDGGVFEFTGHTATISYCDFTSTPLASYPASLEVPITHIAVGVLGKDGTVSEKFGEHLAIGLSLLGQNSSNKK